MEELRGMALASSVTDQAPEAPMLKEQVVEDVLARLRRGTAVLALAAYFYLRLGRALARRRAAG